MITIRKINESYIKVECSTDKIKNQIAYFFTVYAKNFQFHPLYKRHIWDGKIRFFDKRSSLLKIGLLELLEKFLERNYPDEDVEYKDFETKDSKIYTESDFIKYIDYFKSIKLLADDITYISGIDFIDGKRNLFNFQMKSVLNSLNYKKIANIIDTGGGKSASIYLIILILLEIKKINKIYLIVPSKQLVQQMFTDFIDYCSDKKYIENNFQRIYDEIKKDDRDLSKKVIITTWQSMMNLKKVINFENINAIIVDEVHASVNANETKDLLNFSTNAIYKIGFTATFDTSEKSDLFAFLSFFSKIKYYTNLNNLVKRKILSKFLLNVYILNYIFKINQSQIPIFDFNTEVDYFEKLYQKHKIVLDVLKNKVFVTENENKNNNTLILFKKRESAQILYEFLKKELPDNNFKYIDGTIKVKTREEIRNVFETENNLILLASYGTFKQGVNIKNLHNIIFFSTTKSFYNVIQSIGRGLRKYPNKILNIYDLVDKFSCSDTGISKNFSYNHFKKRKEYYDSKQINILLSEINIDID